tara:strand:+ start:651 stop:845 length:195 start_codon:yes stop_codon:yes gene_type:complete
MELPPTGFIRKRNRKDILLTYDEFQIIYLIKKREKEISIKKHKSLVALKKNNRKLAEFNKLILF